MQYYDYRDEIWAVFLLCLGLLILSSFVSFTPDDLRLLTYPANYPLHNWISRVGVGVGFFFFFLWGKAAYIFPVVMISSGVLRLINSQRQLRFPLVGSIFLSSFLASIFALVKYPFADVSSAFNLGGFVGLGFVEFLSKYVGVLGSSIVLVGLFLLAFIMVTGISVMTVARFLMRPIVYVAGLVKWFRSWFLDWFEARQVRPAPKVKASPSRRKAKIEISGSNQKRRAILPVEEEEGESIEDGLYAEAEQDDDAGEYEDEYEEEEDEDEDEDEEVEDGYEGDDEDEIEEEEENLDEEENELVRFDLETKNGKMIKPEKAVEYQLPPEDILDSPVKKRSGPGEDVKKKATILEQTLSEFNIPVKVVNVEVGPVITRYELEPAPGVKIQKIVNLNDDIALNLRAANIRIVAPIPGKGAVGVEVPNANMEPVFLKDIIESDVFQDMGSPLTLGLGKDIAGIPIVADLREMPHLLIAGTTGSGKTVCVNALISSMLFKSSPDILRFIMVDPKMIELIQYNKLPHMLCPVITDAKKVSASLSWLIAEMERRYQRLAKAGVRNIRVYNERNEDEPMPYIVLIIDELADIMAVAQSEVETSIARLAQLSRAVGIHLILATQRPSVDVITGVIKANFPARISFKVASKVDSRTVLDSMGAEKLLGKGDMLFLKPGAAKIQRMQSCYVRDKEIERLVDFWALQGEQEFDESIVKAQTSKFSNGPKDELFDDAVDLVLATGHASVSILQRRMRLGYSRAARLIDMMEEEGIVGPYRGSKPREILVDREEWLMSKENYNVGEN